MCIRDSIVATIRALKMNGGVGKIVAGKPLDPALLENNPEGCLLYTSDAADERSSVDLGGRRLIKKKTYKTNSSVQYLQTKSSNYE